MTIERMEKLFDQVMEQHGYSCWYELYDSPFFDEVEEAISAELGYNCYECETFVQWNRKMAAEL